MKDRKAGPAEETRGAEADPGAEQSERRLSQAAQLIELADGAGVELFHSPASDGYATVPVSDHRETLAIEGRSMRRWLGFLWYRAGKAGAPDSKAMSAAVNHLAARAQYESPELPVFTRVGEFDEAIYLDLGDDTWRAVRIAPGGWSVMQAAPVKFRRSPGAVRLPEPVAGGSLSDLRALLNLRDCDWPLIAGWLLGALSPTGPYPLLILHGEQGSAKSSTARALVSLIDPGRPTLRATPRDDRDLAIAAANRWCLGFDNLSSIPVWLSDQLCQLSTGGGYATRRLQTDDEEMIFEAQRPVLMTGIDELATRGDLLDRAMTVELPRLESRATEREFTAALDAARPRLLGALLDALSVAMDQRGEIQLSDLPRMADFATLVEAAAPALGFERGVFLSTYRDSRATADRVALEASPILGPLERLIDQANGQLRGTGNELLAQLNEEADEAEAKAWGWPRTGSVLSRQLKRLAPNLRSARIADAQAREEGRAGARRNVWTITRMGAL